MASSKNYKKMNVSNIPKEMYSNNMPIPELDLPDTFAYFLWAKPQPLLMKRLLKMMFKMWKTLFVDNDDFMLPNDVLNAVKSIKIKNCEGQDKIPQQILIDGIQYLLGPLSVILNKI